MNSAEKYSRLLGNYAMQYTGVKGFSSTVDTLRDLHIEHQLEAVDLYMDELQSYRELCTQLHDLSKTPQDPHYQRVAKEEQVKASEVASLFPKFHKALSDAIKKIGNGYNAIEKKRKYLMENRNAAVEMINFFKSIDKQLIAKKTAYDEKPIQALLEEMRRAAGDVRPVFNRH